MVFHWRPAFEDVFENVFEKCRPTETMLPAKSIPTTYNGKDRPAWFVGEILSHAGYRELFYCGSLQAEQHLYNTN